ncbi:hypothetical protein Trydic_g20883 [Trypoxylus dichotomus]
MHINQESRVSRLFMERALQCEHGGRRWQPGCPQGAVLSPLLWWLLVDDLLSDPRRAGFYAQGYADDITIMLSGRFEGVVSERMQVALRLVETWCRKEGLNVNSSKTTMSFNDNIEHDRIKMDSLKVCEHLRNMPLKGTSLSMLVLKGPLSMVQTLLLVPNKEQWSYGGMNRREGSRYI